MTNLNPTAITFWGVAAGIGYLIYQDTWHTVLFGVIAMSVSLLYDLLK
jgi:hypothetical protein